MSKITFHSIEYQNFRSVGSSPVKVILDSDKITLVAGSVGSGKSTLIDALSFVLYNRSYSDNTKPSLVNSINQKQLKVTIDLSIDSKKYKIVRGIKPAIFEIYENDVLLNIDAANKDYQMQLEHNILKMNYRGFTQIVIAGGGTEFTPFMKLSAPQRRDFVEELLDIKVFSTMNSIAKDAVKKLKDELKEINSDLKSTKEKCTLQTDFIKKLKKEKSDTSDRILESIKDDQDEINRNSALVENYLLQVESISGKVSSHLKLTKAIEDIDSDISSVESNIVKVKRKKDSYDAIETCPTCSQTVNDSHKSSIINSYDSEIDSFQIELSDLTSTKSEYENRLTEYSSYVTEFKDTHKKISELQQSISSNQLYISKSQKQIDAQSITDLSSEEIKLKEFARLYFELDKDKETILDEQQYYDFILETLTDSGIKSKIIRQYIPEINKRINSYLEKLEFWCMYNLDEEFNESIKSRHRDNFTYDFFSQGQKRLIDLSIIMTFIEIAKSKSNVSCNLWVADELDGPLGLDGSDLMYKMLSASEIKNIFVISHRRDLWEERADNVIEFKLKNNFTEVV